MVRVSLPLRLPIHYKIRQLLVAFVSANFCLVLTSLALPTCYFAALIARANRVCPTLGASFSCLHALMPFVSARHSVAICLGFPTLAGETPQGVRLCPTCAGASVISAQLGTCSPPPYLPCVSARHLLCPSLAFPTSFCHLCLRKVSCALPQHVISPSLPLASMCAVYNIPFKRSCLRHTWRPPQTSSLA